MASFQRGNAEGVSFLESVCWLFCICIYWF